jgi:hypothetical protein
MILYKDSSFFVVENSKYLLVVMLLLKIDWTIFFTEFLISVDLKSNSFVVYKFISKLKNDFFPWEIPLVLRSKSTILLSWKMSALIDL